MKQRIDSFFSEVRRDFSEDFRRSCESAGISAKTISFSQLPISKMHRLCMEPNVSLEAIVSRKVDLSALGCRALPKVYLGDRRYSSRFTSIYMLDFIHQELGELTLRSLLQRHQLRPELFQDVGEKNNILLPADICEYVGSWFGEEFVRRMGQSSLDLFGKTPVGANLRGLGTADFFEKFVVEILPENIERNYLWSIDKLTPRQVVLSGKPREEIRELFHQHRRTTRQLEQLRAGFIESLPQQFGSDSMMLLQTQSFSDNNKMDTYVLDFSTPKQRYLH